MSTYRRWVIAMVLVTCTTLATIAEAQLKMPFKRRTSTASTTRSLALTQADGPWLIMCASFTGERGLQQAIHLTNELRNDHGLDAYLYKHTFDHSEKVQGSGWTIPAEEMGEPVEAKWKASSNDSYDQIAVVVGDFPSVDDNKAKVILERVRNLHPRSMVNDGYVDSNQSLEQQHRARGKGPLGAAFLMPNPILPPEYFKAHNVDKIVEKMNKGVKYSLFKCPGQYSVRVATFRGEQLFDVDASQIAQAKREDTERMRNKKALQDSALVDAGYKANLLCRALRKKGVMAWEFHDRHESYVCVGSFDWATRQDPDTGKDLLNPEILEVISQYKGKRRQTQFGEQMHQQTMAVFKNQDVDIHFDVQPMPVVAPKLKASTARKGLGGLLGR